MPPGDCWARSLQRAAGRCRRSSWTPPLSPPCPISTDASTAALRGRAVLTPNTHELASLLDRDEVSEDDVAEAALAHRRARSAPSSPAAPGWRPAVCGRCPRATPDWARPEAETCSSGALVGLIGRGAIRCRPRSGPSTSMRRPATCSPPGGVASAVSPTRSRGSCRSSCGPSVGTDRPTHRPEQAGYFAIGSRVGAAGVRGSWVPSSSSRWRGSCPVRPRLSVDGGPDGRRRSPRAGRHRRRRPGGIRPCTVDRARSAQTARSRPHM